MLIVRGDAQTLPSERNKSATGEVWFDPILTKTDGVDVGTVVFSPNGRTVWHQHERGQLLQITSGHTTTTIGTTDFQEAVTDADYAGANATARDS